MEILGSHPNESNWKNIFKLDAFFEKSRYSPFHAE
jgi:hypothetical protein